MDGGRGGEVCMCGGVGVFGGKNEYFSRRLLLINILNIAKTTLFFKKNNDDSAVLHIILRLNPC